jgi:mono/diheme cytochrome c family protein
MKRLLAVTALASLAAVHACKVSRPGNLETRAANKAKKVAIGGKEWKNPVPNNEAVIRSGAKYFHQYCQVCHGPDGHNTGVIFADRMSPPVPDLAQEDTQEYTDGQLNWVIQNGIRFTGMPGWEGVLTDRQAWEIVRFIRHLPPKPSSAENPPTANPSVGRDLSQLK